MLNAGGKHGTNVPGDNMELGLAELFLPDPEVRQLPVENYYIRNRRATCRGCSERPVGCWRNHAFGCAKMRQQAEDYAVYHASCPLHKWDVQLKQSCIICVQHSSNPRYDQRWRTCQDTWIKDARLAGIRVVTCTPTQGETHWVDDSLLYCRMVPEAWITLPQLTRNMCAGMLMRDDWSYLFKADDDTFIALRRWVEVDLKGKDYLGGWCRYQGEKYAHGGGGYFLSRKAAMVIADNMVELEGMEDQLVGRHLRNHGIPYHSDYRYVGGGNTSIHRPRPDNRLITVHTKRPHLFYASENDMNQLVVNSANQPPESREARADRVRARLIANARRRP